MGESRQSLKRIVARLFALADLAERAGVRARPILCLVLWILRPAEALARGCVLEAARQASLPARSLESSALPAADMRTEALRLAAAFRMLASVLGSLIEAAALLGSQPRLCQRTEHDLLADIGNLAWHAPQGADSS